LTQSACDTIIAGSRTTIHGRSPVEFVDTRNNKRQGKAWIRPAQAVLAGVPFGRPYASPFSVR